MTRVDAMEGLTPTAVVLYRPKGAGKSQIADILRTHHGVEHVDADALVLDLLAAGVRPDPENGWLLHIEQALRAKLELHSTVSVEATGAWASDWQLAEDLEAAGIRVFRVWVHAPLELTLQRLATRTHPKVPVTSHEARWIWAEATRRARDRRFDLRLDTDQLDQTELPKAVLPLAAVLGPASDPGAP